MLPMLLAASAHVAGCGCRPAHDLYTTASATQAWFSVSHPRPFCSLVHTRSMMMRLKPIQLNSPCSMAYDRCLVFFRDLTEAEAAAAMDEFGQSDITSIRNKSAFLMSILRYSNTCQV